MKLISDVTLVRVGKNFFTYYQKKFWILLLYEDLTGNVEFDNISHAYNNFNESDKQLYSIVSEISNSSKQGNGFEFIISYPLLNEYIHFKQKNFPDYEIDYPGKTSVEGFQLFYPKSGFNGLAKSIYFDTLGCAPSLYDTTLGSGDFGSCVGMAKCNTSWDHKVFPTCFGKATTLQSFWMRTNIAPALLTAHSLRSIFHMRILLFFIILFE